MLKVSSTSNPNSVAGALVATLKANGGQAVIQTVGAGAVNQAVKAIAIARGFVASSDREISCVPSFLDLEIGGEKRTGITLKVNLK